MEMAAAESYYFIFALTSQGINWGGSIWTGCRRSDSLKVFQTYLRSNHLRKMSASMASLCLGLKRNSDTSSGEWSKGSQSPSSPGHQETTVICDWQLLFWRSGSYHPRQQILHQWFEHRCLSMSVFVCRLTWDYCISLFYCILFYFTRWKKYWIFKKISYLLWIRKQNEEDGGNVVGVSFFFVAGLNWNEGFCFADAASTKNYAVIVAAIMTSADIYRKGCKKGSVFNARKRWIYRVLVRRQSFSSSWMAYSMS